MTEFEFIERPDSCPSIVKMWVLPECAPRAIKLRASLDKVEDLDDFAFILTREIGDLETVNPQKLEFLDKNYNTLPPSTNIKSLAETATDINPLVVRYPLSDFGIKAILKFVNNRKEEVKIKYTTGSFDRLQSEAKDRFEFLTDCNLSDIYFEHQGEKIEDAYHFTSLVEENITKVQKKVLSLDLKVLIRNRKPFSDWKLDEVLKNVYNYDCGTLESVSYNFDMENLPQLSPSISDEELNKIIEQLNDKKLVFDKVNINEATAREFISVILVNAVLFVKKNNDSTATLMVEKQFVGSHGYGPFGYVMMIRRMFVLVTEAKPHDPEKGIAQNLAQIDSLSETLGKRKFDQAGIEYESMETMPIIGIVTTGRSWIFIRHTSQTGSRQLEVSSEYECKFMGNDTKDDIKVIVSYVVRLLQAQVSELDKRKSKRSRI